MRWVQHWIIGEHCLEGRRSLPYQLGCLLPDWFERHPIHRVKESFPRFLDRAERIRHLPAGPRRDWLLGTLGHYLCDYCTMAHNEEYYRFYRHRVYEVMAQKYIKARVRKEPLCWQQEREETIPAELLDPKLPADRFREALSAWLTEGLGRLRQEIEALGSPAWYRDERVAELDIRRAHRLLRGLNQILNETDKGA